MALKPDMSLAELECCDEQLSSRHFPILKLQHTLRMAFRCHPPATCGPNCTFRDFGDFLADMERVLTLYDETEAYLEQVRAEYKRMGNGVVPRRTGGQSRVMLNTRLAKDLSNGIIKEYDSLMAKVAEWEDRARCETCASRAIEGKDKAPLLRYRPQPTSMQLAGAGTKPEGSSDVFGTLKENTPTVVIKPTNSRARSDMPHQQHGRTIDRTMMPTRRLHAPEPAPKASTTSKQLIKASTCGQFLVPLGASSKPIRTPILAPKSHVPTLRVKGYSFASPIVTSSASIQVKHGSTRTGLKPWTLTPKPSILCIEKPSTRASREQNPLTLVSDVSTAIKKSSSVRSEPPTPAPKVSKATTDPEVIRLRAQLTQYDAYRRHLMERCQAWADEASVCDQERRENNITRPKVTQDITLTGEGSGTGQRRGVDTTDDNVRVDALQAESSQSQHRLEQQWRFARQQQPKALKRKRILRLP
ncbi:hypothetical protein HYDPIDRAFT_186109 [Hydnomerulius pinastri MD-312]|nr:hypothetical protein HYDPIDRAFT_186109 [Hydnomerulius pinastri MD-312]